MGKTIMYERIYADLLAKIQNGDYQPGDRLPSEKESAESREEVLLCAVRLLLWR